MGERSGRVSGSRRSPVLGSGSRLSMIGRRAALTGSGPACEHYAVPTASTLLAEELYAAADPGFLKALYDVQVPRGTVTAKGWGGQVPTPFERKPQKAHPLGSFAKRWLEDPRPWAREQLRRYLIDGCDRPGHRTLVKRLFKGAEDRQEHDLIALFLVAFDRMRRVRTRTRRIYDWTTRRLTEHDEIVDVRPRTPGAFHFSQRTRNYLQARAARYVRALGARDAAAYRRTVLGALSHYEDTDFSAGYQLLRMRGLASLLFPRSEVLDRRGRTLRVPPGKALAELTPRPLHAGHWESASAEILEALLDTRSLFVRRQLVAWLERDFASALSGIDVAFVRRLLSSAHPDLQVFGAKLLSSAAGLENLRIDDWLSLLASDNAEVLPVVAARMGELVTPARATLSQCVQLARHVAHAPAMLGVEWAETKTLDTKEDLELALPILDASVREARERAVTWLLSVILREGLGLDAHLREVLDARHPDVRERGFALLESTPRFRHSIVLWAALAESPHADARAFLLSLLARERDVLEATLLGEKSLHHLWATTLLEVNRGSRAKQRALDQLGRRIEAQPQLADELLPLLVIALRSVREPERRGALASLVRAATRQPEVRDAIARHAPEIGFGAAGAPGAGAGVGPGVGKVA